MLFAPSSVLIFGLMLSPVAALLAVALLAFWYLRQWNQPPRWQEATRHEFRPYMQIERLIRFRWIHRDCRYWILPVRLDRGPIRIRGRANAALYWNLTYYQGTEVNPSVSSKSLPLTADGRYEIVLKTGATAANAIAVRPGAKRGVLYLRIYEPVALYPTYLPEVMQNGRVLTEESCE